MLPFRQHHFLPEYQSFLRSGIDLAIVDSLLCSSQVCSWDFIQAGYVFAKRVDLVPESGELAPPDAATMLILVAVVEEMEEIGEVLKGLLGVFGEFQILVGGHVD